MLRKTAVSVLTATLIFFSPAWAETVSEDDVKAAFIFHFINFTQWDDAETEYTVCIPDDQVLREAAEQTFAGKAINGRRVNVTAGTEGCHILVSNEPPYSRSALTIGPLQKGAAMEFCVIGNKMKFAVDLDKVKKAKYKISSQLLKLAILR